MKMREDDPRSVTTATYVGSEHSVKYNVLKCYPWNVRTPLIRPIRSESVSFM